MAKIVGFGQTGFVARMQKQSLFGYEPYGQMERTYSPYAFAADSVTDSPPAMMDCPGGQTPVFNTASQEWECPPSVMACPGGATPIRAGIGWTCPGDTIGMRSLGEREQMQLALVNRKCGGCLDPSDYGADRTREIDGDFGSRSQRAMTSYAARRGISISNLPAVLNALSAETSSDLVMRDPAEYKKLKDRINGVQVQACPSGTQGVYPNCVPIPAATCPEGTEGTPPNCKPKRGLANIIIGASLLTVAVGALALAARNRNE